eukprot:evm.model.scf_390.5 EVM.evm.TU.scf_390.5   scf_390:86747-92034(-)
MCRVAASAGGLDGPGMERAGLLAERLEGRHPPVGSGAVGLSSFLRRSERGEMVVRRGDASSVMRVDRAGGPAAFGAVAEPLDRGPSLVFEMELDDKDDMHARASELGAVPSAERLKALLEPRSVEERKLLESVEHLVVSQSNEFVHNGQQMIRIAARRVDLNALAVGLQSQGYAVSIRKAVGGGNGGECLKNLRHSFLRCSMPGADRVYIVDPYFRDQFDVHRPTPGYLMLFEGIPETLVAPEERVPQVVNLLCTEMLQVFRHEGIIVPPWRKASSMITKWLPRRSLDETPMGIKTSAFPTKMPAPRGDSRFRTALAPRDLIKAVREQAKEQTANAPHLGSRGPRAGSAGAVMGFAMDGGDRKAPDWLFG